MMGRILGSLAALCFIAVGASAGAATSFTSDPKTSRLEFAGIQAGAEFKGSFVKFATAVEFAPDALAAAHIDVVIDLDSLDTKDKDRDQTMRGPDIFDIKRFPTAHYVTRSIAKTAAGYSATGSLTLHGVTKDVPLVLQFVPTATGAKLNGTAQLKRLDFGVGQGDWKSTEWVKDDVKVAFSLVLTPKQ